MKVELVDWKGLKLYWTGFRVRWENQLKAAVDEINRPRGRIKQ